MNVNKIDDNSRADITALILKASGIKETRESDDVEVSFPSTCCYHGQDCFVLADQKQSQDLSKLGAKPSQPQVKPQPATTSGTSNEEGFWDNFAAGAKSVVPDSLSAGEKVMSASVPAAAMAGTGVGQAVWFLSTGATVFVGERRFLHGFSLYMNSNPRDDGKAAHLMGAGLTQMAGSPILGPVYLSEVISRM